MNDKKISVDKIVEICQGVVVSRGIASTCNDFCCDTRLLKKGDTFLALKCEAENVIKYIEDAFEKGAIGCICECDVPESLKNKYNDKFIIKVRDSVEAIQKLAEYKRSLYNIPVIAVTGSVGKTSTKEIIASVVGEAFNVKKNQGNYNNHIGVPLTILSWDENTECAVVEMGMNHFGEIEVLTKIAKPTVAVITNVGTAHIGILGSRENILKAKMEILDGLQTGGTVVINNDNDLLHTCDLSNYNKVTYGIENESDYMAFDIKREESSSEYKIKIDEKEYKVFVPLAGDHFIYNSLCSIAVGKALNIETEKIIQGIKNFELTGKRNEIIEKNGLKIINDYYNASLDSMKASLGVLKNINATRKIAILGDMLELGEYSEKLHREVGSEVAKDEVDVLCTVGRLAKDIAKEATTLGTKEVYSFDTNEECIEKLKQIINKGDCILLKASNRMRFGDISNFLQGENLWERKD